MRLRLLFEAVNPTPFVLLLQTFILAMVSSMTLFFAIDNTTDRVMVTLTTMLVLATFITTIQGVGHTTKLCFNKTFITWSKTCFSSTDPSQDSVLQADWLLVVVLHDANCGYHDSSHLCVSCSDQGQVSGDSKFFILLLPAQPTKDLDGIGHTQNVCQ